MKILIGARSVYEQGGMQRSTIQLANYFAEAGHQVMLVGATQFLEKIFYPLNQCIELVNIYPLYPKFSLKSIPVKLLYKFFRRLNGIVSSLEKSWLYQWLEWKAGCLDQVECWKRLIVNAKPDVVIGISPDTFTILSRALIKSSTPLITCNHSNPMMDYSASRWSSNIVDIEYRKQAPKLAAANTVLLPEFREYFPPSVQKKTYVIGNPVEQIPLSLRSNPGKNTDEMTIITTGRYDVNKDYQTLISAFSKICKKYPDWQLKLFGEGPFRQELQRQIEDLQLQTCVKLMGYSNDINEEYRKSQILAMPSRFEGFGLSIAEAMAHGLPCIGFDDASGVNSLIIHNKTGFLADGANRIASLSKYLEKLIVNPVLREKFGDQAHLRAEEFAPNRIFPLWETCIQNVVYYV